DAICQQGTCVACGDPTQPCCALQCHTGAVCMGASCVSCGGADEPCCGGACDVDTLSCVSGTCRACITQIAAGGSHACALKTDGSVWCWGGNADGQLGTSSTSGIGPVRSAISDVKTVAASHLNTCVVKSDGSVWCWGAGNEILSAGGTSSAPGVP